jgi:transcriptional regulator GlxA family with amidase domain
MGEILPIAGHNEGMLANVAVVIMNGFTPFELGVLCEVFGVDRTDDGLPAYDFAVVSGEATVSGGAAVPSQAALPGTATGPGESLVPGRAAGPAPLTSAAGFTVSTPHGLDRLAEADLVAVAAVSDDQIGTPASGPFPAPLTEALRASVDRGARVLSVCTGAFVLGAAGLLDGRRCTTHWRHAPALARQHPSAIVNPDVLYVDEDPVITSAGTAAGIDACLHLVRKEQGSRVANGIARRMVIPPHRDGGQAQYVDRPVAMPACDTLAEVISWMQRHLGEPVTIHQLATRARMSERTFARRFVQETGITPLRWLTGQRILLAQELLEETAETVDVIADRAGFGNAATLRHHFRAWRGTTPQAYRRAFSPDAIPDHPAAIPA